MISWSEEFTVNNPSIDMEHRSLFAALNKFYDGLKANASKESMSALITNLIYYANTHFENEEMHMRKIGFPGIDLHIKEHREFISKTKEFQCKFESGKLIVSFEVTNFIKDWITNHIKTQDKQYAVFSK
jgi:hemerythrin